MRNLRNSSRTDRSLRPLLVFDSTAAIGRLDQDADSTLDNFIFGELMDAKLDGAGNVLLLDRAYGVVRVFDSTGKPVQIVGRQGSGPGEFQRPESIVTLAADEFGVFDARPARLERFRTSSNGYVAYARTLLAVVPRPEAVCATRDRQYVKGVRLRAGGADVSAENMRRLDLNTASVVDGFVHQLDAQGAITRSFSTPYRQFNDDPFLAVYFNEEGGLACSDDGVWVGYGVLGEVHAFDDDGELKWIARITDLQHPGYLYRWSAAGEKLPRSGSLNIDLKKGNYSYEWISRLTLLRQDLLAVSVTRRIIGAAADKFPVTFAHRTYLLNARTGRQVGTIPGTHQILGGGIGLAVFYQDDPFPRFSLVRLEH